MGWKKVDQGKPDHDCTCLILNIYGINAILARYDKRHDVFILSNLSVRETICMNATHYLEIPNYPKQEMSKNES